MSWLCISSTFCLTASGEEKVSRKNDKAPKYGQKSDLRYSVCHGAWSGETIALFNTWSAPDTNPERRLRLASPDGKKEIKVSGFHVRLVVNGKAYWTPLGNMHDAELAWSADSTRLFVTWSETGELGAWHV